MSVSSFGRLRNMLLAGCAGLALLPAGALAQAKDRVNFDIPGQDLGTALTQFGQQSEREIVFPADLTRNHRAPAVYGDLTPNQALDVLLADSGLSYRTSATGSILVESAGPQGSSAGGGADTNVVQELVVTAQRKEEAIQTVPIAISAFTQKSLEEQHIEGGFDLLKAIPNVTFSKNNFSGYNFSIRGIGTKAISVTTDPGVAVEFNSTALIRNRLFEQEYFDVERVEVLRGPQGTLHGRNATAGVINVISAKPTDQFAGQIKAEVGNYQSRRASGFINIPIIGDKLDVRFAGSFTDRDGYDYNATTQNRINGRNLWSGRLTVGFKPFERLHGDFVWEHFDENDNRSRTGKQLCHRDPGPSSVGAADPNPSPLLDGLLSQGCKPGSLYDDSAFGTPNGLSIPFMFAGVSGLGLTSIGYNKSLNPDGSVNSPYEFPVGAINPVDPYGGMMQSRNLRVINSIKDPKYRAKADVMELNFDFDLTPSLTITSQTAYDKDQVYSFQDYNRFNTVPVINDSSNVWDVSYGQDVGYYYVPGALRGLTPGGVYCDPQLGCSNTIAGFDISQAKSTQFSQELRMQSSFSGRFNFSAGVNYTHYKTLEDYYVMYNLITLLAQTNGQLGNFNDDVNVATCRGGVPLGSPGAKGCIYIDPNPVDKINGEGHNYFRSENPYKLSSAAAFGELYWQMSDSLKLTAGLRYTDDRKTFTPVPSQVLLSTYGANGGTVDRGYPALPDIKQSWGEFTGRAGVDWTPHLPFTDQTMIYAFYSRGYKGGGANPPGIGYAKVNPFDPSQPPFFQGVSYPPTFKPEFVNAFEVGAKNTLMGGALVLNGDVFFYDYKDYQVSQIKERTAVNENFNAKVWGLELESIFQPSRDLRFNATFGYQSTRIGDGAKSIDLMNRTQGHTDWVVLKPGPQLASNCIAPRSLVEETVANSVGHFGSDYAGVFQICPGWFASNHYNAQAATWPNGSAGFDADLSGKELPNAPHFTISLGGQKSWAFLEGWRATFRADAYWQSQSWARVYNDNPYDKLHGWYNANLSLWFEKPDTGLKIELYVKNVLNKTPITDAFLNSDDTALTTNVFVLDPRLIGFSITKTF